MTQNYRNLIWIIFLIALLRFPSLYTPVIDIDESQYGEFALKVVNGELPYVSSVGEKPPLMYYYFIWIFELFGKNNYYALHGVTIIWVMASAVIIYLIGKERYNEKVGLMSALFYAVFSTTHEPKITSTNGETLMTLPLVLGIYFFSLYEVRSKKILFLFWAGVFTGLAALFRHQAGMQIGFLGLYFFIRYFFLDKSMNSITEFLKRLAANAFLGLSFLIPIGIALSILYFIGVYDEFIFWSFSYNLKYIEAGSQVISYKLGLIRITVFILFTFPAWYYIFKGLRHQFPKFLSQLKNRQLDQENLSYFFLIFWFILSCYPVFVGWRFYSHYFIQIFPSLFLLAGLTAQNLFEGFFPKGLFSFGQKKLAFVILAYAFIFFIPRIDSDTTMNVIKQISPSAAKIGVYPEQKIVAQYIKERSKASDTIFVWGFATPIYVYADRECGSMFSWTDFLSGRIPGQSTAQSNTEFFIQQDKDHDSWKQFYKDMNRYKPLYFVDTAYGDYHEYGSFSIERYEKFGLPQFLKRYYEYETTISQMRLYRRKGKN